MVPLHHYVLQKHTLGGVIEPKNYTKLDLTTPKRIATRYCAHLGISSRIINPPINSPCHLYKLPNFRSKIQNKLSDDDTAGKKNSIVAIILMSHARRWNVLQGENIPERKRCAFCRAKNETVARDVEPTYVLRASYICEWTVQRPRGSSRELSPRGAFLNANNARESFCWTGGWGWFASTS